jgi:hypothetical protein
MTDPAQTDRPAGTAPGIVDEFAHIPRSRARHPLVAVAGALLAFFLVFHSRRELRYALLGGEPLDLGSARQTFGAGKIPPDLENRYVRTAGMPDRESALELDTKGSWVFSQFFRVLGTGDRLFLHRRESPLPAARAESDVFEGRLMRVDDLPFAAAIRRYFATHVAATHFFAPEAFARALAAPRAGPTLAVVDRSGDAVSLADGETVAIDVSQPDQVQIGLPRARFATEEDAGAALTSRGGEIVKVLGSIKAKPSASAPEAGPLSATPEPPERWTFLVEFPAAERQAALDALGNLDRVVEIRDARQTIEVKVADVSAAAGGAGSRLPEGALPAGGQPAGGSPAGGLIVRPGQGPARQLSLASIVAIHTMAPVLIPDDAYLLVEGETPREHLPTIFLALVLVMFGAVNLVGLLRELSR